MGSSFSEAGRKETAMSSTPEALRPLSGDALKSVSGGGSLPIPPIHGGPVHTPVLPIVAPPPRPGSGLL
jgi:hypothetical protein